MSRVTIQQIAEAAGISKAAVSMALRNHPRISKPQRDRVKAIARKMGYRADLAVSRIASLRWKDQVASEGSRIAFVTTQHPVDKTVNLRLFQHIRDVAKPMGYALELFQLEEFGGAAHLGKVLRQRGIEGILLDRVFVPNFAETFPWKWFAAVALYEGYYDLPVENVTPNYDHSMYTCWRKAREVGYERIGVVLFQEASKSYMNQAYVAAYMKCCSDDEIPGLPVCFIRHSELNIFNDWFTLNQPDAIIGFTDAVYWHAHTLGVRIPEQVAFCSLHSDHAEPVCAAGMRSLSNHIAELALQIVDMRLRNFQIGPPPHHIAHRVDFDWEPGPTLPLCAKANPLEEASGPAGRSRRLSTNKRGNAAPDL